MKILITGGAGYIGSVLVRHLLDHLNPPHVTVVDNLTYGGASLLPYVDNPLFNFVQGDVRDPKVMAPLLAKADVILPLAALVGFPLCDRRPIEAVQVNYEANRWLAANKSKDQIVVYPCTNSGYGATTGAPCTEASPINPVSLYGRTKVDAEQVFQQTPNCTTLRLATVFGASTRPRTDLLVNNFVWKAMKDRALVLYECTFMRNYVHVRDVAAAFEFVLDNWSACGNETFNVGNDALNCNKLQLAEAVARHVQPCEIIRAEINSDPDVRNYVVSSAKIEARGFRCRHGLDDGIRELVKSYRLIDTPVHGNY